MQSVLVRVLAADESLKEQPRLRSSNDLLETWGDLQVASNGYPQAVACPRPRSGRARKKILPKRKVNSERKVATDLLTRVSFEFVYRHRHHAAV